MVMIGCETSGDKGGQGEPLPRQVTEGEGYPEATQTRRVRRLLGEVLQLPGEEAADGILTVPLSSAERI